VGELEHSTRPIAAILGHTSKGRAEEGKGKVKKEGEVRERGAPLLFKFTPLATGCLLNT